MDELVTLSISTWPNQGQDLSAWLCVYMFTWGSRPEESVAGSQAICWGSGKGRHSKIERRTYVFATTKG